VQYDLEHLLIKSLIDTIPLSFLLLDTILFKEYNYLHVLLNEVSKGMQKDRIRELCFCKYSKESINPEDMPFPYGIYYREYFNKKDLLSERKDCRDLCPVCGNIFNINHEAIKSPKFILNEINKKCLNGIIREEWVDKKIEEYVLSDESHKILNRIYNKNVNKDLTNMDQAILTINAILKRMPKPTRTIFLKSNTLHLLILKIKLNKLLESGNIIFNNNELERMNLDDELKVLVHLFKHKKHDKLFKPMQLNRILLEKMYPGAFSENKNVNPLWKLIYNNGICRVSLVQFYETFAIQFATFALLLYIENNHINIIYFFLICTAFLFYVSIRVRNRCPVHNWYKFEIGGFPMRIIFILFFWLAFFSFSMILYYPM